MAMVVIKQAYKNKTSTENPTTKPNKNKTNHDSVTSYYTRLLQLSEPSRNKKIKRKIGVNKV